MNIIKLALAKTRRTKRVRNLKEALKSIHNKKANRRITKGIDDKSRLVIIAASTQGNTKIATVDYSIKKMLDEWQIKNQIIFCGGGLTACSMREVEKIDQGVVSDSDKYSTHHFLQFKERSRRKRSKEEENNNIQHINFEEACQSINQATKR